MFVEIENNEEGSILIDTNFKHNFGENSMNWEKFLKIFVKVYESKNINPAPELVRYLLWYRNLWQGDYDDQAVINNIKKYLPDYFNEFNKYLVLV